MLFQVWFLRFAVSAQLATMFLVPSCAPLWIIMLPRMVIKDGDVDTGMTALVLPFVTINNYMLADDRNMQMMISSLLHHTGYNEQLYKPSLVGGGIYGFSVPSTNGPSCGASLRPSSAAFPVVNVEMVSLGSFN